MNKSEEEQLLQDASTLLMFANVAAKQHHPPGPPIQQQQRSLQSPQQQHTQPPHVSLGQPQSPAIIGQGQPHFKPIPGIAPPPPPPTGLPTVYLNYPSILSPSGATPPAVYPPPISGPNSIGSSHSAHGSAHGSTQGSAPGSGQNSISGPSDRAEKSDILPPIKPYYFTNQQGVITRSPTLPTASAPADTAAAAADPVPVTATSPAPATATTPAPATALPTLKSPAQIHQLPPQATFPSHKRTGSGKFLHSPGPANIALLGGITDSGVQRNSNNAMIAAAALEDAAKMPLPLFKKEEAEIKRHETIIEDKRDETEVEDETEDEKVEEEEVIKEQTQQPSSKEIQRREVEVDEAQALHTKEGKANEETKVGEVTEVEKVESLPEVNTEVKTKVKEEKRPKKETLTVPPLRSYQVDPDAGLIGCICGIEDDDGFTIQCDICFRWQHCLCMNFKTNEEVPDVYKCYYCDEDKWGKFDPEQCKIDTLERLEGEAEQVAKKDLKRKHLNSEKVDKRKKTLESRKRNDDETNGNGVDDKKGEDDKNPLNNRKGGSIIMNLPNKENILLEGGITAELYQGTFYKLRDNDYKTQDVKSQFEEYAQEYKKSNALEGMSKSEFKAIKWSKIKLPNFDKLSDQPKRKNIYNDTMIQVKQYSENQKQKFNGISKLGLFVSGGKKNHLRKESGGSDDEGDRIVSSIPVGTPIIEYLGELAPFQQYKDDSTNQYNIWGVPKPRVCKIELPVSKENFVPIVSDSRFVGNESRFIRSSCPLNANCIIKPIFIKDLNIFKFMVVTSKEIQFTEQSTEEELRLKWNWDEKHPIRKMYEGNEGNNKLEAVKFDQFSEPDKAMLISCVDTVMSFVECACGTASSNNNNCALFKIKKATAYLLRSTRKALSVSSLGLTKSREVLIVNKKPKKYISWQDRLDERDKLITMSLLFTGEVTEDLLDEDTESKVDEAEGSMEVDEEAAADDVTLENNVDGEEIEIVGDLPNSEEIPVVKRIPYREQLLQKSRKLKDCKFEVEKSTVNETVCVPVVPELIIQIHDEVNKKISIPDIQTVIPLAKLKEESISIPLPDAQSSSAAKPGSESRLASIAAAVKSTNTVTPVADTVPEIAKVEPIAKPQVVKKLSFADYKKKMK